MNITLLKALLAMVPISVLSFGSGILFRKERTLGSYLQLVGAGCLVIVVLIHFCEALHLFPWMNWGDEHSGGHYHDLGSTVLGLTLFPVGYLSPALSEQKRISYAIYERLSALPVMKLQPVVVLERQT